MMMPMSERPEGDLVGDELGGAPDPAQEREPVAGGPAAEDDPIDAQGEHGQHKKKPGVEVEDLEVDGPAPEANYRQTARRRW